MPGRLGRRKPSDWKHVDRYPLRGLAAADRPAQVPGALGINWYSNFDRPVKDGTRYWIGRGDLGSVRGGHAICVKPYSVGDDLAWWDYYDQGDEGACVGFSCSRMMTLLNRRRYDARWLYQQAQLVDEYADTPPEEGSSVRAGCSVLQARGHVRYAYGRDYPASAAEGIAAYRWAATWDEVRATVGVPDWLGGVPLLNSWGRYYPHIVILTDEAGERVLAEDGEFCVITDR